MSYRQLWGSAGEQWSSQPNRTIDPPSCSRTGLRPNRTWAQTAPRPVFGYLLISCSVKWTERSPDKTHPQQEPGRGSGAEAWKGLGERDVLLEDKEEETIRGRRRYEDGVEVLSQYQVLFCLTGSLGPKPWKRKRKSRLKLSEGEEKVSLRIWIICSGSCWGRKSKRWMNKWEDGGKSKHWLWWSEGRRLVWCFLARHPPTLVFSMLWPGDPCRPGAGLRRSNLRPNYLSRGCSAITGAGSAQR